MNKSAATSETHEAISSGETRESSFTNEEREHTSATETDVTSETLVMLFRRAVHGMMRSHHHHGHSHHAQAHILFILKERNSITQRDLMEMLNVRSASLSEILGKLERNGFIERKRDEYDKRNIVITITEQGSTAMSEYQQGRSKSADALFASLTADERLKLSDILNKIINSLEQDLSGSEAYHDHHDHHDHGHDHGCGHSHGYSDRDGEGHRHRRGDGDTREFRMPGKRHGDRHSY
jgi:DNA-binding MarR family transcriptional regulator